MLLITGIIITPAVAIFEPESAHDEVIFSETTDIIVESDHPYADNFEYTWMVEQPGANQMRIHFEKLELASGDYLKIYDKQMNELVNFGYTSVENSWSEWQTTDALNLKLITNNDGTAYGFLVDQIEYRNETIPSTTYLAESYHPYANNYQYSWTVSQPGADQMRIRFKKIDIGGGDYLRVYDKQMNYLGYYSSFSKDYFWTEWQTTDAINLELTTNNDGNSYGFIVDQIEYRNETIPSTTYLAESYHPYANNYQYKWTVEQPGADQMRIRFNKVDIGGGDYLRIYDKQMNYLGYYSSFSKDYFWTEWQTTDAINLELTTNNDGNSYGFIVDQIEYRNETIPSTTYLAESYHPYANNYQYKWTVEQPGADQMRIRFNKVDIGGGDYLRIYDKQMNYLGYYSSFSKDYFWTEWQTTDAINLELTTNNDGNSYGFIVDQIEHRVEPSPSTSYFAESYHPYANNYQHIWTVEHPGADQMRIQFKKIDIGGGDYLRIYDKQMNYLGYYSSLSKEYFWTDWQTTDTFNLELTTNNDNNAYGFIVDLIETEDGIISPPSSTIGLSFSPLTGAVQTGDTMQYAVVMNDAPTGLSVYNFMISLTEPAIGEITAIAYPAWATVQAGSTLPADSVIVQAADMTDAISTGAMNVTLCTLTVRGDGEGETGLTISSAEVEDDDSVIYTTETTGAVLTVENPPPPPEANFTANVTSGAAPLTVLFTDTSTVTPTGWEWVFGDGNTSTEQNPAYTYEIPGIYNVTLTVTDAESTYSLTKTGYISVTPHQDYSVNISLTPGWNMISVPVADAELTVPPEIGSTVYQYNTPDRVYVPVDITAIIPCQGYWVSATDTCVITATGDRMECYATDLDEGWNLIGSVCNTTSFNDIQTDPAGSIQDYAYAYDTLTESYVSTTSFTPCCGYWVSATTECAFNVNGDS